MLFCSVTPCFLILSLSSSPSWGPWFCFLNRIVSFIKKYRTNGRQRKNFWKNFTEGTGSVWILQDQTNLYCQRWNIFAVYSQSVQTLSFHSPVTPRPVVLSLAVPCKTNYPGQPSKSAGNNWKPFVDWIWPAGSQEGFWALTNASLRKENLLSLSLPPLFAFPVPAVTEFSSAAGWLCRRTRSELGLAEATWWERTGRAGLFQGWVPARQLAGWKECTCIRNVFAATASAQPGLSMSTAGRCTSAQWLRRTEGELLAKDKMAQIIDSKTTALQEWRQKKESRKQNRGEKTAQLQKWFSNISHQRSTIIAVKKKKNKQNFPMEITFGS